MQARSCRTSSMDKLAAKMDVKILYSVLVFHYDIFRYYSIVTGKDYDVSL